VTSADEALAKAEELVTTLNVRREELEKLASADDIDADAAVELIAELSELAKQIEAELTRARALADAGLPPTDATS
jgi:flagellar hook-associated protein FlgK